jgi:tRNA(Met) cytidine acetyltransferase
VFGLLVLAHYRTRPSDLRRLLDGPNLQVHVLRRAERVMATALVAREGGFDAETATDIWSGRRRPHGHLLPESLAFHLGVEEAATLRFSRIVRIAVHPALRRRGLGLRLVAAVEDEARRDGADFTGTSFGADIGLLRFWGRAGMAPVRIGVKRGATSGAWSVLMTKPLSEAGRRIQERMRARHRERLPALLGDPLADLDLALADVLLEPGDEPAPAPPDREAFVELASFAYASRTFEAAYPVLASWAPPTLSCASLRAALPAADRHLLIARLLQHRSFAATATLLGLSGRDEVVRRLRSAVAAVLDTLDRERATALAERLRPRR